ncbi:MAG: heterodisulfide reductase-related iron-sulfur binding cluster [Myxococcota bacterium]|nr:heterodisulfide reductase-related iron-sulfur binding cluster [Myxococcota bacterium]
MQVLPPDTPTEDWSYDDPDYWDQSKLEAELRRSADVCHQCRRCLPLCPSFPKLFELVDATDQEIAGVAMQGFDEVNELCFHCAQCYNHCPYTAPHEWDIDFPKLMRRHQLQRAKRDGVPLTRKLTTRTDLIGKLGRAAPALLNLANKNRLSRVMMEKTVGIDRDWIQPTYYGETLEDWWRQRKAPAGPSNRKVVLFPTCSVNFSDPDTGRAAVEVLEHNGIEVDLSYDRCCGMPFTDTGDLDTARRNAARNVEALLPHVEAGAQVLVPGPSCSLMMKHEYPKLLGTAEAERVSGAVHDLMEYLFHIGREKRLDREFPNPLGRVAYHAPCHLRAQNVGFPSRALLKLAGADVELIDACSGVDGTWGMQVRFRDESQGVASKLIKRIESADADEISTDCPLAALRIEERTGRKPQHPIRLLQRAYGLADA